MLVPLFVLAAGALLAGFVFKDYFIGHDHEHFWHGAVFMAEGNEIMEAMHHVPAWVIYSPMVAMILGFVMSYIFYIAKPSLPGSLAARHELLYRFLLNKWYFDELYDFLFVRSLKWLGRFLWKRGDGWLIDGFGPDGIAARVADVTARVVRLQSGYLYHYAFAMLIGVAALITWYMFAGSAH